MNSAAIPRVETQSRDIAAVSAVGFPAVPRVSLLVYGICALLFFAVLSFGAVEEWSLTSLEAASALFLLGWAARQAASGEIKIQPSPLYTPGVLFGTVVIMQLGLKTTSSRYITSIAGLEYVAYGILLFLTINIIDNERSTQIITWALTLFGFLLAVFAIAQDLTSNGKLYWLRTAANGGWIFGPYVNHNHYAGLMEMLAPMPIVLSLSSLLHGGKRVLVGFAGVLMAGTIVLSQSRSGTVSFLAETALLFALSLSKLKNGRRGAAVGVVWIFVLAFVAWMGTAAMWHRLTDLSDEMRLTMAKDGVRMFWHKPVLGWGLGTFTTVYPQFRSFYTNLFVNAAHNDYVQMLVETGLIGFTAAVWFIVAVYRSGLRNADGWTRDWSRTLGLAALVGCSGLLVHSAFDFNLQIPANACFFYFLCGVTTSTASIPRMMVRRGPGRNFKKQSSNSPFD